jgi:hypothetical protein
MLTASRRWLRWKSSAKAVERQRQHRRLRQQQLQRQLRPPPPPPQDLNGDTNGYCDGHRHRISNGDTTTRNSSYANTAPSANTAATPITL